jgi:hypothetical protein
MSSSWIGVSLAAALIASGAHEPRDSGAVGDADVRRQLDDLIEKTNALDAFVAEYELESSQGTQSLRLQLRDSTNARMEMLHDGEMAHMVIVDGVLAVRMPGDASREGSRSWSVDVESIWAAWRDQLDDALSANWKEVGGSSAWAEARSGCRPFFVLRAADGREGKGGNVGLDIQIGFASMRAPRFSWLHNFRDHADEIRSDGDSMQIEEEKSTTTISAATGFVTSIQMVGEQGRAELRLVRLLRDDEVEVDPIELPAGERATNPEAEALMEVFGMSAAVDDLLHFVQESEGDARMEWNDETRGKLRLALRAYSGRTIERAASNYLTATRERIDEMVTNLRDWEREKVDSGTDPAIARADARRSIADRRGELVERLDKQRETTLDRLLHRSSGPEHALRAQLIGIEREAGLGAWEDVASGPILAYFDEQLVEPWAD